MPMLEGTSLELTESDFDIGTRGDSRVSSSA